MLIYMEQAVDICFKAVPVHSVFRNLTYWTQKIWPGWYAGNFDLTPPGAEGRQKVTNPYVVDCFNTKSKHG